MSIAIPTGHSRSGVALPDVAPTTRTRLRPVAAVALLTYTACTIAAGVAAWAANADTSEGADRVELLWQIACGTVLLAVVVTARWAHRVASDAKRGGVPNVRPGRIALAWFVPLFGPPAAIRQLGRLVREYDYSERRLGFWMFALYAHLACLVGTSVVVVSRAEAPDGVPLLEDVQRMTSVLWLHAAMSAVLTVLAGRAIVHADRALSVGGSRRAR